MNGYPPNAIPEGYVRSELQVGEDRVIIFRNPDPIPEEREKNLQEVANIFVRGYLRRLEREKNKKRA